MAYAAYSISLHLAECAVVDRPKIQSVSTRWPYCQWIGIDYQTTCSYRRKIQPSVLLCRNFSFEMRCKKLSDVIYDQKELIMKQEGVQLNVCVLQSGLIKLLWCFQFWQNIIIIAGKILEWKLIDMIIAGVILWCGSEGRSLDCITHAYLRLLPLNFNLWPTLLYNVDTPP